MKIRNLLIFSLFREFFNIEWISYPTSRWCNGWGSHFPLFPIGRKGLIFHREFSSRRLLVSQLLFPRYYLGVRCISTRSDDQKRQLESRQKEFLSTVIEKQITLFNDLVRRNAGRGLINHLLRVIRSVLPSLGSDTVTSVVCFVKKVHHLWRGQGFSGTTLYLKAAQVVLQQSVAKYHVKDIGELKARPKRNRTGLPLIIPAHHRRAIRMGDMKMIQLWMTLLGLYRILSFKGQLKLSTITTPFEVSSKVLLEWGDFLRDHFSQLFRAVDIKVKVPRLDPITTSSPTSSVQRKMFGRGKSVISTHLWSLWQGAVLWAQSDLFSDMKEFSRALSMFGIWNRILLIADSSPVKADMRSDNWRHVTTLYDRNPTDTEFSFLGKLSLKFEAAGKIRVFAMVDAWTQWLMRPLADLIFSILRRLPTDGTFNQVEPVDRLKAKQVFPVYSLDLSAATDRLPLSLQKMLMAWIHQIYLQKSDLEELTPESIAFGERWGNILVGRFFVLQLSKKDLLKMKKPDSALYVLKYAVGQPMGALSSWAMLALVHHAIVSWAAYRVRLYDFSDYAILGDDVVIANFKVANSYLQILQEIGVSVGLAKSIISKRRFVAEFAKKFFVDLNRPDMVPFKDCAACFASTRLVKEFAAKWNMQESALLSFLGYGYRSKSYYFSRDLYKLGIRERVLLVWFQAPGMAFSRKSWVEWLWMRSHSRQWDQEKALNLKIAHILIQLCLDKFESIKRLLIKYKESISSFSKEADSANPVYAKVLTSRSMDVIREDYDLVPWYRILATAPNQIVDTGPQVDEHGNMRVRGTFLNMQLPDTKWDDDVFKYRIDLVGQKASLLMELDFAKMVNDVPGFINKWLDWLYRDKPYEAILPMEYWPDSRSKELEFDDFQALYSVFVKLSKPIYAQKGGINLAKTKPKKGLIVRTKKLVVVEGTDRWLRERVLLFDFKFKSRIQLSTTFFTATLVDPYFSFLEVLRKFLYSSFFNLYISVIFGFILWSFLLTLPELVPATSNDLPLWGWLFIVVAGMLFFSLLTIFFSVSVKDAGTSMDSLFSSRGSDPIISVSDASVSTVNTVESVGSDPLISVLDHATETEDMRFWIRTPFSGELCEIVVNSETLQNIGDPFYPWFTLF